MNRDKFPEVLKLLLVIVIILLLFGFVPNMNIKYKHFNMLSGIIHENVVEEEIEIIQEDSCIDDTLAALVLSDDSIQQQKDSTRIVRSEKEQGVEIMDYSQDGNSLGSLFEALRECRKGNRIVRIAVLGDSFIEADYLTSKLRTLMQSEYTGSGVGFVPITSPAPQSRKTIQQTFAGWTTHSIVHYKNADWKRFCLSGYYFIPSEGASFTLKTMKSEAVTRASLFFINQKHAKLEVSINGGPVKVYEPETSDDLQYLAFSDHATRTLDVKVKNVDGFTAFGTYLDNSYGVYVDNYSVRGCSGTALVTINKELTEQFKKWVTYDLLIVEYGLNVIANENNSGYRKLMEASVRHLKECYPDVPVLLMSIGDKSSNTTDGFITDPGVLPLINIQRRVAQETGICFWNTYNAMGGERSMVDFVNHTPPMAYKDYTHINSAGGDFIAKRLFEAFKLEQTRLLP